MESRGTIKVIEFAMIFQKNFEEGGTLLMDEIDNALHSEIVKGIIAYLTTTLKRLSLKTI